MKWCKLCRGTELPLHRVICSAALVEDAPTDGEIARLRILHETGSLGSAGYGVACCFASALYARSELCMRARQGLTHRLLRMGQPRLLALQDACAPLAHNELPWLLDVLYATKLCVDPTKSRAKGALFKSVGSHLCQWPSCSAPHALVI